MFLPIDVSGGCVAAMAILIAMLFLMPLGYYARRRQSYRPSRRFYRSSRFSRSSRSSTYKGVIKAEKQVSMVLMLLAVATVIILSLAPMIYGGQAWSMSGAKTLIIDTFTAHIGEFLAIICGAAMIYHKARNITMIGLGTFCIGYLVLLLRLVWV